MFVSPKTDLRLLFGCRRQQTEGRVDFTGEVVDLADESNPGETKEAGWSNGRRRKTNRFFSKDGIDFKGKAC